MVSVATLSIPIQQHQHHLLLINITTTTTNQNMTTIRSNKENVVAFRTPLAGEKGNGNVTARKPVLNGLKTPATAARVPFGGKSTNIAGHQTGKKPLQSVKRPDATIRRSIGTPSLNTSSSQFTVSNDSVTQVPENEYPDIEHTPSPEKDTFQYDDLDLDIDFDFIAKSIAIPVYLQPTGDLDRPIDVHVHRDSETKRIVDRTRKQATPKPIFGKQTPKTPSRSFASRRPNFMAPTSSTLSKRTLKPSRPHSNELFGGAPGSLEDEMVRITDDEILSGLDQNL